MGTIVTKDHPENGAGLKRCFGLKESITITVGTVIGVGLFTVGGNVAGMMGPGVFWATLAALAVSVYPSMLYAEMSAALPFAGGTYQYASLGLGELWGMLAGWNFIISMAAVASGEALAFSFYMRTLFEGLGISIPLGDTALACAAAGAFLLLSVRGAELTGRMQNGFLFFFWGVAAVWLVSILPSLDNSVFAEGMTAEIGGFLPAAAMIWWCFAGFETCCAMGEEIRCPQKNLPRALMLAPFIVFAVNGFFQWALLCIADSSGLGKVAEAAAPFAEGMKQAGLTGLPLILLCAGVAFGGDFSTLNASMSAPARYLYTMAREGNAPAIFSRIHPVYRTPWIASLGLGALVLLLIGTGSIAYIASLSLFATLFYYVIGIAAAWGLRRRRPELERPYRAPFFKVGVPVSMAVYLLMMTQLDRGGILAGIIWCALGLGYYLLGKRGTGKGILRGETRPLPDLPPLPPLPGEEELFQLDREFRRWRNVVAAAVFLVIALYLIMYLTA
ncbi:APC family permease [Bacilliculturomica massiliensis]|uniref:APC family permease n=1 Tax=Bacilliculturomica massiliensis TaxID=1917867 RepID=UPI0010319472|nr:APC family permease [Bacilliculturomica massiliensis]